METTMSPDGWLKQSRKVSRIEREARFHGRRMTATRRQMRAWFARFGDPEIIAWAFAAGLVWASGRSASRQGANGGRSVMWLANSALLAWQFITQVRATGAALGLGRPRSRQPSTSPHNDVSGGRAPRA
jgi:hypothetical protein